MAKKTPTVDLDSRKADKLVRNHLKTIHTEEFKGKRGPGGLPVVEEGRD